MKPMNSYGRSAPAVQGPLLLKKTWWRRFFLCRLPYFFIVEVLSRPLANKKQKQCARLTDRSTRTAARVACGSSRARASAVAASAP